MDGTAAKNLDEEKEVSEVFNPADIVFTAKVRAANGIPFSSGGESAPGRDQTQTNTRTIALVPSDHEILRNDFDSTGSSSWSMMTKEIVEGVASKLQSDLIMQLQEKVAQLSLQVEELKKEMGKGKTGDKTQVLPSSEKTPEERLRSMINLILKKHVEFKNEFASLEADLVKYRITPRFKQLANGRLKLMLASKPSAKADLIMLNKLLQQL